jgi:mannose-6-phosphate isomerase
VGAAAEARRTAGIGEVQRWIVELARHYPGDVGVLAPLLLNLLQLRPGDTVFLEAGALHAYLEGAGVELMANSDNVLRGGLTRKYVNVAELLHVVSFESREVRLAEREALPGGESAYRTPAPEFRLSEVRLQPGRPCVRGGRRSVEIFVCLAGAGTIHPQGSSEAVTLRPGTAVLVPAALPGYRLEGGGRLYKAAVPVA